MVSARALRPLCLLLTIVFLPTDLRAETVIGVVNDGPRARPLIPLAAITNEIDKLTADEFDVRVPSAKSLEGDWTLPGVRRALEQQLADPEVDIVLCLGLLSCHEAARIPGLAKPVIATVVADAELQEFPLREGVSGKQNFVYVTNFHSIDEDLRSFREALPYKQLAIIVDQLTLDSVSAFTEQKRRQLEQALSVSITLVPIGNTVESALARLPAGTDAVYLTPLLRFDDAGITALAEGLATRRLPSYSLYGVTEVELGILMATGGRAEDLVRISRRIALTVQSILLGEAPEAIPVGLQQSRRLAINMRTANRIGFSPRYAVLADAEQLFVDDVDAGEPLTLAEAMLEATQANLGLQAASFDPMLAAEDVRTARAELLPQLDLSGEWRRIDGDRAFGPTNPEESSDVSLTGRQIIYSDDVWAGYQISQYLQGATDEDYRAAVLDTLQTSGKTYLSLLRAIALEAVQRSNLEVTRANLELARVRESIGFSGRADVLRWESQLARDRRNLIASEASRRQAEDLLNQVLNRPQSSRIQPMDQSVEQTLAFFQQSRFQALIDNARVWTTFQDFVVESGLERVPEIRQAEQLVLASDRQVTAARRKFWLPEFAVEASGSENLNRSGDGSDGLDIGGMTLFDIDDSSWTVGVSANLPIFSGGALRSDLNSSRFSQRQLQRRRDAIAQDVETRIRVTLEEVSSSYAAIELTAAALQASTENLKIVTDSYSQGAVSVTDLIDAQNAALGSELSAAEAKYVYLSDVIDVFRESGSFQLMLEPQYANEWFREVEEYFDAKGVQLAF